MGDVVPPAANGTVVVITGASAGIGAATARVLARRGMRLLLVARREAELKAVAERCDGRAAVFAGDVTERSVVREAVSAAIARYGRIDVWINNAGRGITRMPSELTDDDVAGMMRVNVLSALYGMQEVLPHFRERGEGHVINVSSLLGRIPYAAFRSAYVGAKHFLNALTVTMRAEVQQSHPGIQFSLVSPGVVATEFGRSALHGGPDSRQLPEPQEAEEIAEIIAQVIESKAPDVYTRAGARARVLEYYQITGADPGSRR